MKKIFKAILLPILSFAVISPVYSADIQPVSPVIHIINNFEKEGYYYDNNFYPLDETVKWAQGFCYHVLDEENKTAVILGYDRAVINGDELIIPTEINGYKIQGFSHGVFSGSSFKRCDLSDFPNLSQIMFASSELEEVILSKQTKIIPTQCFAFTKLKKIQLPNGLEEIKMGAFQDCLFTKLVIPGTVKSIGGQGFEGCDNLTEIEFKNGFLTEIGSDDDQLQWTFMTKNLKKLTLPENIKHIGKYEFMESTVGRHWYVPVKYPDNLTIYGKKGSYAETYAAEHELSFVPIESENSTSNKEKVNFESKYDISQFMDSSIYKIHDVFDTDYGAVVYYSMGGFMRAPGPGLSLVRENGDIVNLSLCVSMKNPYRRPEHNDITLSEDGKYVTFNVSFDERAEGPEGMLGGSIVVFHDAGTYYYKADLKTGVCIETKFEPLDTISEEVISAWAKPEVENAIETGFVPISLRGNYKRNITRREFAKMAFYFLSVQYGYRPESALETWYQSENPDYAVRTENFVSAYCSGRKDRNGNIFTNKNTGEAWKYEDKHGGIYNLTLASPFTDLQAAGDGMNTAAQRAVIGENQIIDYAYNFGIINGKSDTEFDPHGEITRQEAAAMLMRVYKNYADVNIALGDTKFSDDDKISDWAKDDVYNINVLGVMQGVGENTFAPLEGYTVEQSVATFWRLYDKAPLSRKNKNIEPLLKYSYERENFFTNVPGTSVFTAEKESPYEEYTVVRGYHRRYHRKNDYRAYVFYKYGGCLDLLSFIPISQDNSEEIEEAEVNSVENVIKFIAKVPDSFRLYNKLNGSEKVYAAGKYSFEIDLVTGNILSLIRIS